jgi:transcriptional regulator with XRE-family HTH domain
VREHIRADILPAMDVAQALRSARLAAGLSQTALAARSGTSQATISAYENGRKLPSIETLSRLLGATGNRLSVRPGAVREPSRQELARAGRTLAQVLGLAEALPHGRAGALRYPRLAA